MRTLSLRLFLTFFVTSSGFTTLGAALALDPQCELAAHFPQIAADFAQGKLSLKYAYVGSEGSLYANHVFSEGRLDTEDVVRARQILSFNRANFDWSQPWRWVDIGALDGVVGANLVRSLMRNFPWATAPEICALDISRGNLNLAVAHYAREFARPAAQIKSLVKDLETGTFREALGPGPRTIFNFVGSSLGNYEDPVATLRNIRDSMRPGDTLLVSVYKYRPDEVARILEIYANLPLSFAALERLGFTRDDGNLRATFEESTLTAFVDFTFARNHRIELPNGEVLDARVGQKIEVLRSQRFRKGELAPLFKAAGFEDFRISDSKYYFLIQAHQR